MSELLYRSLRSKISGNFELTLLDEAVRKSIVFPWYPVDQQQRSKHANIIMSETSLRYQRLPACSNVLATQTKLLFMNIHL